MGNWSWQKDGYVGPKTVDEAYAIKKAKEQKVLNSADNLTTQDLLKTSPIKTPILDYSTPSYELPTMGSSSVFEQKQNDLLGEEGYSSPSFDMPTFNVQYGDNNDNVKMVQGLLEKAGYDTGGIDGIFGNNTLNALMKFQADKGLDVDGIIGPQTSSKLLSLPDSNNTVSNTNVNSFGDFKTLENLSLPDYSTKVFEQKNIPDNEPINNIPSPSMGDFKALDNSSKNIPMPNLTNYRFDKVPDLKEILPDNIPQQAVSEPSTDSGWLGTLKNVFTKAIPYGAQQGLNSFNANMVKDISLINDISNSTVGKALPSPIQALQPLKNIKNIYDYGLKKFTGKDTGDTIGEALKKAENYYSGIEQTASQKYANLGTAEKIIGEGTANVVSLIPSIMLSIMSGGSSMAAATPIDDVTNLAMGINKGETIRFGQKLKDMVPFMTYAAGGYARDAEKQGASPIQQLQHGIVSGLAEGVTELIPFGFMTKALGIGEDFAKPVAKKGAKELLKSFGESGISYLEHLGSNIAQEIAVNPMTNFSEKMTYNQDMPWTGDNGVFSMQQSADSTVGAIGMEIVLMALGLPTRTASHIMAKKMVNGNNVSQEDLKILQQLLEDEIKNNPDLLTESQSVPEDYSSYSQELDNNSLQTLNNNDVTPVDNTPVQNTPVSSQEPSTTILSNEGDNFAPIENEGQNADIKPDNGESKPISVQDRIAQLRDSVDNVKTLKQWQQAQLLVEHELRKAYNNKDYSKADIEELVRIQNVNSEKHGPNLIDDSKPTGRTANETVNAEPTVTEPNKKYPNEITEEDFKTDVTKLSNEELHNFNRHLFRDGWDSKNYKWEFKDKTLRPVIDAVGKEIKERGNEIIKKATREEILKTIVGQNFSGFKLNPNNTATQNIAILKKDYANSGQTITKDHFNVGFTMHDSKGSKFNGSNRKEVFTWSEIYNEILRQMRSKNEQETTKPNSQEGTSQPTGRTPKAHIVSIKKVKFHDGIFYKAVLSDGNYMRYGIKRNGDIYFNGAYNEADPKTNINSSAYDYNEGFRKIKNNEIDNKDDYAESPSKEKFGKKGNALLKKWARNEIFNVDLNKPDNADTKAFLSMFTKFYEAGLSASGKDSRTQFQIKSEVERNLTDAEIEFAKPWFIDEVFKAGIEDSLAKETKPKNKTTGEQKPAETTPTEKQETESKPTNTAVTDNEKEYPVGTVLENNKGYKWVIQSWDGDKAKLIQNEKGWKIDVSKEGLEKRFKIVPKQTKPEEKPTAETNVSKQENSGIIEVKEESKENPSSKIANKVVELLEEDEPFTFAELTKIADEAYGGTQSQNTYTSKDAYDATELGVNLYILKHLSNIIKADGYVAKKNVQVLRELIGLIPTQTKGNREQQEFQQFSTPPNIAYVASWVANINKQDTMLEPSAGIGGLAVFAKAAGAKVIVNELSDRRLEVIKNLPFDGFYNENAEHISDILSDKVSPSVIVMNPPFSSTAGRMGDKNNTANAKLHIEQALNILQDNGRLVAILGQGMYDQAPAFTKWWDDIKSKYNVRVNIGIYEPSDTSYIQHSVEYKKYGTDFGVQIVVIDKTGPTPKSENGYETITGANPKLESIIDMLEGIKNDRTAVETNRASEQTTRINPGKEGVGENGGNTGNEQPVHSPTNTVGDRTGDSKRGEPGNSEENTRPTGDDGTRQGNPVSRPDNKPNRNEGNVKTTETDSGISTVNTNGAVTGNESNVNKSDNVDVLNTEQISKEKQINKVDEDAVYSEYAPQKVKIKGAQPHASPLVQSTAMASVPPPDVDYTPKIPKEIIISGDLSLTQMEAIIYTGQQHQNENPDGTRKGFFIGDGTGVGKGRTIAGIILDNWNQGRKKAVWISKNGPLFEDAIRDWTALGGNEKDVFEAPANKPIERNTGIMFTTYYTIKEGQKPNKKTGKEAELNRINQIIQWVGKDFDGVIIFDEAHMMQNLLGTKPAEMAKAGVKLQESLPNARIVYASATGATEVENLAYAPRLGLWGIGTSFSDVGDFIGKIKSGGLAAMELVARDMKAMGTYIARNISFIGVKYDTKVHELTDIQKEIYDTMADGWQIVLQNMNKYLEKTGQNKNGKAKKYVMQNFWSTQQRFFNQVLTSMQMPTVIEDMKKRLANGEACVLQLVNTNASAEEREVSRIEEEGGSLDDMDITPKGALLEMINKCFPTQLYEEFLDDKGKKQTRAVVDSKGKPVESAEALRAKAELMKQIDMMQVPSSPMDMVFQEFGIENVTEVTGRPRRFVFKRDKFGDLKRVEESRTPKVVESDVNDFINDKKQILIFSDAGGTGKSYHAGKDFKNQRHRVHYLIQAGWNASKAVQGFGRTHRTNQVSAPEYVLVTTNLKGQKRFISSIARRLDQLGALTKGQRDTGSSGLFSAKDNLESREARKALELFYRQLVEKRIPGLIPEPLLKKMGLLEKIIKDGQLTSDVQELQDVTRFLNRILVLKSDEQNQVFDEFMRRLDYIVEEAIRNDTLDIGLENYKNEGATVTEEKVIHTDPTGAETKYVAITAKQTAYFWTYKELKANEDFKGIYKNKETGEIRAALHAVDKTNADGSISRMYYMQSPTYGKRSNIVEKSLNEKWEPVNKDEEKSLWNKELKAQPKFIEEKLHLISGALLPIWNRLPTDHARVIRITTDDGNSHLGRIVASHQIDETLRRLGVSRAKEVFNVAESIKKVLENNMLIRLVDRTVIKRVKVAGEYRLEIIGQNLWSLERNYPGIFSERINSSYRYFLPTDEKGVKILEDLTKSAPILEVVYNKEDDTKAFTGTQQNHMPRGDNSSESSKTVDDLIEIIEKHTGIPVRTGKFRNKALGIFKVGPEVIRTKVRGDMPIISHELGHSLDKEYDFSSKSTYDNELLSLGQNTSKPSYSRKEIREEGIAEFLRLYLTYPDQANKLAPRFLAHFETTIDSDSLKFLSMLRTEITAIKNLPSNKKIWNDVSDRETRTTIYRGNNWWNHFTNAWINEQGPFARIQKYAVEHGWTGKNIDVMAQIYKGFEAKALDMFYDKQRDLQGNIIGDSIEDILKPISSKEVRKRKGNPIQERKDFITYMIACRAMDYKARKLVMPEPWYVYEDNINTMESKYSHFIDIFNGLRKWEDNNLQLLVVSGIKTQKEIEDIKFVNANHVPLHRIREAADVVRAGSGSTLGQSKEVIKRATGSGATIIDPLESMIADAFIIRRAAEANMINGILYNMADLEGIGNEIEKVPPGLRKSTLSVSEIRKQMIKVAEAEITDLMKQTQSQKRDDEIKRVVAYKESIENMSDKELESAMSVYRPLFQEKDNEITVYENGNKHLLMVNTELYKAIKGLNREQLNVIMRIFNVVKNVKQAGIVTSIPFAMRNLVRDFGTSLIQSEAGINHLDILSGYTSAAAKDKWFHEWIAAGGATEYINISNRHQAQKIEDSILGLTVSDKSKLLLEAIKEVKSNNNARTRSKLLNAVNTMKDMPIDAIRNVVSVSESGARIAEFRKAVESGVDKQTAAAWSRKLSVDFLRHGYTGKQANAVIAFFNANVQGIVRMAETFKAHPLRTLFRGFTHVTLLTMLLYFFNHDDENYQNLEPYRKSLFWNIPIGGGHFFSIPKPPGYGWIFGTLPEFAMDKLLKDDPTAFKNIRDTFWQSFQLPMDISATGPAIDVLMNKSWTGAPIESVSDQNTSSFLKRNNRTSTLSNFIGDRLQNEKGLSPKQIDYLIKGYFGTVGDALWRLPDFVKKGVETPTDITEYPVIKSFIVDSAYSSDSLNKLYNYGEELSVRLNTLKDTGKYPAMGNMPVEKQQNLFSNGLEPARIEYNNIAEDFKEARKEINKIESSDKYTPAQKKIKARGIQIKMNKLAADYNSKYESFKQKYNIK